MRTLASEAPKEIEQTKAALASLPAQPTPPFPADATLPQIEQAISQASGRAGETAEGIGRRRGGVEGPRQPAGEDPRANQRREEAAGRDQRPASVAAAGRREAGRDLRPADDPLGPAAHGGTGNRLLREGTGGLRGADRVAAAAPRSRRAADRPGRAGDQAVAGDCATGAGSRKPSSRRNRPRGRPARPIRAVLRDLAKKNAELAAEAEALAEAIVDTTRQLEQVNAEARTP